MERFATADLILMFFVLPVWILAGFLDWLCHRRARIEKSTGVKESAVHILMFAEVGVPLLAALFLEITAGLILFMAVAALIHDATAYWDLRIAATGREITPFEQHIHSYLGLIPFTALLLILSSRWDVVAPIFTVGGKRTLEISWKAYPLPSAYVVSLLVIIVLCIVLPYAEEMARCVRTRAKT